MLIKTFSFAKEVKNFSDAEAMQEALDPESQSRLLFSYGGKFIESAENFRRGLQLMEKFRTWRAIQAEAAMNNQFNTPTQGNIGLDIICSTIGLERFVMEEIAANSEVDIYKEDPERLFGMEHNKATRIIGLRYFDGNFGALLGIPVEKRDFLCDVLDVMNGPLPRTPAEKATKGKNLPYESIFLARAFKHYVELLSLRNQGLLDRAHIMQVLYSDFGLPADAPNEDMAFTYTLSKDENGAVTITYSEPNGLKDKDDKPLHFHWTATVALDGTTTSTPLVIDS